MIMKQMTARRKKSTRSFFEISTRWEIKRTGESSVSFLSKFIGFGFVNRGQDTVETQE
jgi:hypothetical protein